MGQRSWYDWCMDPAEQSRRLERLRGFRNRPKKDLSLGAAIEGERKVIERAHKAVGGLGAIWAEVVPEELASRTAPAKISRGVLTVRAADASAMYELDRWMRTGGREALAKRGATTIRRVKIVTSG